MSNRRNGNNRRNDRHPNAPDEVMPDELAGDEDSPESDVSFRQTLPVRSTGGDRLERLAEGLGDALAHTARVAGIDPAYMIANARAVQVVSLSEGVDRFRGFFAGAGEPVGDDEIATLDFYSVASPNLIFRVLIFYQLCQAVRAFKPGHFVSIQFLGRVQTDSARQAVKSASIMELEMQRGAFLDPAHPGALAYERAVSSFRDPSEIINSYLTRR